MYESTFNELGKFTFDYGFYFIFSKSGLYYQYPPMLIDMKWDFVNNGGAANQADCYDISTGERPAYFYPFCYYLIADLLLEFSSLGLSKAETSIKIYKPYQYNDEIRLSICIPVYINDAFDVALVCTDFKINSLVNNLNYFNSHVKGYYYVVVPDYYYLSTIEADVFYYPNYDKLNRYYNDPDFPVIKTLLGYEFSTNRSYYIYDMIPYEDFEAEILVKTYEQSDLNGTDFITFPSDSFVVNNSMEILPIFIFSNPHNANATQHVLTLVFKHDIAKIVSFLQILIEEFLKPRVYEQIIISFIMFLTIVLIVRNLLFGIANNIVKPIRSLNSMILGMRSKIAKSDNKNENEFDFFYDEVNEPLLSEEGEASKQFKDEEEIFENRSEEIEKLFDTLMKLKSALSITSKTEEELGENKLMSILFSKYVFNDVNNLKCGNICNSNVGNLSLKSLKFDKAVIHFLDTIDFEEYLPPDEYVVDKLDLSEDFLSLQNKEAESEKLTKSKTSGKGCKYYL